MKSCPQNVKEWNEAAAKKGCKKLSHSCPSFEYHCVINAWGNETIEVCAPSLMIIGKHVGIYNQMHAYQFIGLYVHISKASFVQFSYKSLLHLLPILFRKCMRRI